MNDNVPCRQWKVQLILFKNASLTSASSILCTDTYHKTKQAKGGDL